MRKNSREEDPIERARRKVAKAQLKLHVAEEEQLQVRAKGKQEVEKARLKAAKWQARAAELVEKRSAVLLRSEARLRTLVQDKLQSVAPANGSPSTPVTVAETLEAIETRAEEERPDNALLMPEQADVPTP